MEWYLKVMMENFSNFSGRARRKEFWMWYLFYVIVLIVAMILDGVLGTGFEISYGVTTPYGWIYILAALAHVIPGLAVSVRRLHDVGQSGWMLLIGIIPIVNLVGGFVLLYWFIFGAGEEQENRFGPVPTNMLE